MPSWGWFPHPILRRMAAGYGLKPQNSICARAGRRMRALLAPLAYQPHADSIAVLATKLIAMIDSGEIDKAMEAIDPKPEPAVAEPGKTKRH
jgi:hypothetical protein